MTVRETKANKNIMHACNWVVGGLENGLQDESEDSASYKACKALLQDHNALVQEVYDMAVSTICGPGSVQFDPRATKQYLRDINFLGKAKLMEIADFWVTKSGY